jgi:putative transposase
MRSRYKVFDDQYTYFITSSIHCWVPLIIDESLFEIIIDGLVFAQRKKGLEIYAYVIMLNHIHAVIGHNNSSEIPNIIRDFKKHTSKEIKKHLCTLGRYSNHYWLKPSKQQGTKVWQEGYHPIAIFSETVLEQKIEYIHQNPVKKGYVAKPEDWKYSSARNYILEDSSLIKMDTIF